MFVYVEWKGKKTLIKLHGWSSVNDDHFALMGAMQSLQKEIRMVLQTVEGIEQLLTTAKSQVCFCFIQIQDYLCVDDFMDLTYVKI